MPSHTAKFWDSEKGKYVTKTFEFNRALWRNSMGREYAERHGLIKKYNLK